MNIQTQQKLLNQAGDLAYSTEILREFMEYYNHNDCTYVLKTIDSFEINDLAINLDYISDIGIVLFFIEIYKNYDQFIKCLEKHRRNKYEILMKLHRLLLNSYARIYNSTQLRKSTDTHIINAVNNLEYLNELKSQMYQEIKRYITALAINDNSITKFVRKYIISISYINSSTGLELVELLIRYNIDMDTAADAIFQIVNNQSSENYDDLDIMNRVLIIIETLLDRLPENEPRYQAIKQEIYPTLNVLFNIHNLPHDIIVNINRHLY